MQLRTRISILGACAALAVSGVALSGCGSSSTVDPVAQAAEVTAQQSGAQIALVEQLSGGGIPAGTTISGTGYVNAHTRQSQLTFDFSKIPGFAALGGGNATATLQIQYPTLYMNFPALASQLPGGKTWIKIDLGAVAQAQGLNLSALSSSGGIDPNQYLSYLRAAGSQLTTVGTETINGVTTTHYRTTIDLSHVADAVPAADRASVQAGVAQLEKTSGLTTIPIDVWIDAQHRVRREQFTVTTNTARARGVTVTARVDYLSFGPTPAITPPPASSVYDLTSLVASQSG